MKRHYAYKGFVVTVELEVLSGTSGNTALLPPKGYVALVEVRREDLARPFVPALRLTSDKLRPFVSEGDALMAGFSAGQRIIDDTLTAGGV
jgi:hypothetical protein